MAGSQPTLNRAGYEHQSGSGAIFCCDPVSLPTTANLRFILFESGQVSNAYDRPSFAKPSGLMADAKLHSSTCAFMVGVLDLPLPVIRYSAASLCRFKNFEAYCLGHDVRSLA